MKKFLILGICVVSLVILGSASGCSDEESTTTKKTIEQNDEVTNEANDTQASNDQVEETDPPAEAAPLKGDRVKISTPFGDMIAVLYDDCPEHKANFLKLANEGFYDDLLFHRVIKDFMVQGGDPNSRGAAPGARLGNGGPGYTIPAEFNPAYVHKKGALSAARQGDQVNPEKRSSGSQFYVVQGTVQPPAGLTRFEQSISTSTGQKFAYTPEQVKTYEELGGTPFLDMNYTVFGEIVEGLEIIDQIAAVKTAPGDRPVEDVWMKMEVIK